MQFSCWLLMNIKQHLHAAAPTNHTQTHSSTCCRGFVGERWEKTRGIGWCAEDCCNIFSMMQFNESISRPFEICHSIWKTLSVYYCHHNLLYFSETHCCLYLKRFVSQNLKMLTNQSVQTKPLVHSTGRWINIHIVQRALTLGLNLTK